MVLHRDNNRGEYKGVLSRFLLIFVLLVLLLSFSTGENITTNSTKQNATLNTTNLTTITDLYTPLTFNQTNTTPDTTQESDSLTNTFLTPMQENPHNSLQGETTQLTLWLAQENEGEKTVISFNANYTNNATGEALVGLQTYCELREESTGTWSSPQLFFFVDATKTYVTTIPFTQKDFLYQVSCVHEGEDLSFIGSVEASLWEATTHSTVVATHNATANQTELEGDVALEAAAPTTVEEVFVPLLSYEETQQHVGNELENDSFITANETNLWIHFKTEEQLTLQARYFGGNTPLFGLDTFCELRENATGNWSRPQILFYNEQQQAYEEELTPLYLPFWYQVNCENGKGFDNLSVIDSYPSPEQINTQEQTIEIIELSEPLEGFNSNQSFSAFTQLGEFKLRVQEGIITHFGVDEELNVAFTIKELEAGQELDVSLQLPIPVPESQYLYLWKEINDELIQIPYEFAGDRSTLILHLQDGVIDDDGLADGTITDPIHFVLTTKSTDVTRTNARSALITTGEQDLGVTIHQGSLEGVQIVDARNLPSVPVPPASFDFNLLKLVVTDAEEVDVFFTSTDFAPSTVVWKFNSRTYEWYTFPHERVDKETIKITLIDGGLGDDDGVVNGIIVDDVGIVAGETNLTIWDLAESETVTSEGVMTFYARYINDTDSTPINQTGAYCSLIENSTGSWSNPTNMSYSVGNERYEYNKSITTTGFFFFNVSCYNNQGHANITLQDNFTISVGTPSASLVPPTLSSGSLTNKTTIQAAVSASDAESNIATFIDYDGSTMAWYRMDEVTGTTLENYIGGPSGTISGGAAQQEGALGQAIGLNGGTQYVTLSTPLRVESVSLWANFSAISSTSYFLGGTAQGVRYSGTEFLVFNGGTGWTTVPWTKQNGWVHFGAVRVNASYYDIYINGVNIGTGYAGAGGADIAIQYLGRRSDGYYFNGPLDDVIFFNRTLTTQEVSALYASGLSASINTNFTNQTQGVHTMRAYVQDQAGNVASSAQTTITIDTTAPNLTINNPKEQVYTKQNLTINISASDNNAVGTIRFSWNGTNTTYTNPTNATFPEGVTVLEVWVNDSVGNKNYTSVNFTVNLTYIDNQTPSVSILSPLNKTYNQNPILISIDATDDVEVDTIKYSWNGTNTTYTTPINVSFAQGTNQLQVWVNDTNNNSNYTSVTFFLESLGPSTSLTSPTSGNRTNKTSIIISASASDAGRGGGNVNLFADLDNSLVGWWQLDGITGTLVPSTVAGTTGTISGGATVTSGLLGDALNFSGAGSVSIGSSDGFGLGANMTLSTWYTCEPGRHGLVSSPQAGRLVNLHRASPGTAFAIIVGSDGLGWYNSGAGSYQADGVEPCDGTWHLATLTLDSNGAIQLYKDANPVQSGSGGSVSFSSYPLYLGSYEGTTRFFNGSLDDVMIFNRTLTQDDVSALLVGGVSTNLNTNYSLPGEKNHTIQVYAQDSYGNIGTNSPVWFYVDTIVPQATIQEPQNKLYDNATQTIRILANDTNLDTIWYSWNGTNATYTAPVNVTFTEGKKFLQVWVNDSLGNSNYTTRNFSINTDWAPQYINQSPRDGNVTVEAVNFTCTFKDNVSMANISLYLTNSSNESLSYNASQAVSGLVANASWNYSLTPGIYTWTCLGIDNNSNQTWANNYSLSINNAANAVYTNFTGATTDFNTHPTPESVSGAIIEVPSLGRITWPGLINATNQNFDNAIAITNASISLDATLLHASFNTTANLTLYGLSFTYPVLYRNGALCSGCTKYSYSSGTLLFGVNAFSTYTAAEGTNLSIWDETDSFIVYTGANNTFYANYTNVTDGSPINGVGAWCSFTENKSGSWSAPVNMSFNSDLDIYEYNKTFSANGTAYFNVSCYNTLGFANLSASELFNITQLPTREIYITNITFVPSDPSENQDVTVRVNVTNTGTNATGHFALALNISLWNGTKSLNETQVVNNINISGQSWEWVDFTWTAGAGTYIFDAKADNDSVVVELNETNNTFAVNITIESWVVFNGQSESFLYLGDDDAATMMAWTTTPFGHILFSDADASYIVNDLEPLNTGTNDFLNADEALGMLGFVDSVQVLFDTDGNDVADQTDWFFVMGRNITNVPTIPSASGSSFVTGILWDSGDGGGEYVGAQDIVFITKILNETTGGYGTYDYEITVPTQLKTAVPGTNLLMRHIELR